MGTHPIFESDFDCLTDKMCEKVSSWKSFGGDQNIYSHQSSELGCEMKFSVFKPAGDGPFNILWYLSGLTCNEQNAIQKGNIQSNAASHNIVVVCPDTSPRGIGIEGEDDSWDFGTGAGFYVDATEEKWKSYRMYSYITTELPKIITKIDILQGKLTQKHAITGHSMGGHGALICALKNPGKYVSASAFAPISAPMKCPWGEKCFTNYLGSDKNSWTTYDSSVLAGLYNGQKLKILIDQGSEDNFLQQKQLLPEELCDKASKNENIDLNYRLQNGYDHSYYFIATFMKDHIDFHSKNF